MILDMVEWAKKRFWETVSTVCVDGASLYKVYLDKRLLNTPNKKPLILPTKEMANHVVFEWESQGDKVDPLTMPYTRSANSSIDKVAPQTDEIRKLVTDYGDSDLICYRADKPKELVRRQEKIWSNLVLWSASDLNAPLNIFEGVVYAPQPSQSILEFEKQVSNLNTFQLCALYDLVTISGSLVLSLAVIKNFLNLDNAWSACQVDEDWQQENWGIDEVESVRTLNRKTAFFHAASFYKVS
ncbi:MAG: ATPase [Paracoccaceae bacterium]|nr:ATPase [Paracoccaceae bacterium]